MSVNYKIDANSQILGYNWWRKYDSSASRALWTGVQITNTKKDEDGRIIATREIMNEMLPFKSVREYRRIAIRKTTTGATNVWLDPNNKIIVEGSIGTLGLDHSSVGGCWLDADSDGNPTIPYDLRDVPSSFGSKDPLSPIPDDEDYTGIDRIYVPYTHSMTLLQARNVVIKRTGDTRYFDFSQASVKYNTVSHSGSVYGVPNRRPFNYPSPVTVKAYDESYLKNVKRSLPKPYVSVNNMNLGDMNLPDLFYNNISSRYIQVFMEGTIPIPLNLYMYVHEPGSDYYGYHNDFKVNDTLGQNGQNRMMSADVAIIPEATNIHSNFLERYWYFSRTDQGSGTWVDSSTYIAEMFDLFRRDTNVNDWRIFSRHSAVNADISRQATYVSFSTFPAVEGALSWSLSDDNDPGDYKNRAGRLGLPDRLFFRDGYTKSDYIRDNTAFDLLLVFVDRYYVTVSIEVHQVNRTDPIEQAQHGGIHSPLKYHYYSVSKGSPTFFNSYVWGTFRQIVPVLPKNRQTA